PPAVTQSKSEGHGSQLEQARVQYPPSCGDAQNPCRQSALVEQAVPMSPGVLPIGLTSMVISAETVWLPQPSFRTPLICVVPAGTMPARTEIRQGAARTVISTRLPA